MKKVNKFVKSNMIDVQKPISRQDFIDGLKDKIVSASFLFFILVNFVDILVCSSAYT